ncbi:hypothetical protein VPH35_058116 [Triticum aestivum]
MARQCCLLLLVTAVTVMAFGVAGASKDVTGGLPPVRLLRPLLAALPSAAAPTGFASLRSSSGGNGTAFARGICFGESPARGDCRECLATAIERIGICEGDPHRRGAFWNDGCFLAYSDANTTEEDGDERRWMSFTAHDSTVYPRFYDVETLAGQARSLVPRAAANATAGMLAAASAALQANSTVRAVAQCPPWNVTAAECALCLGRRKYILSRSVQDFPEILKSHDGARPGVASVHRYRCNLRFEISAPDLLPAGVEARIRKALIVFIVGAVAIVVGIVAIITGVVVLLVMKRRKKMKKEAQAALSTPTI